MTTIKPLGDRVLIKRSKAQTTKGGILLPDSAQEKPREGTIVSTGPGKTDEDGKLIPLSVKVGDCVLFGPYSGTPLKEETTGEDEEMLIMSESDILGILSS